MGREEILAMPRRNIVSDLVDRLNVDGIEYTPVTYYYTPLTMYPRSLTPMASSNPAQSFALSDSETMFYVHIPFCTARCTFCPFYLDVAKSVDNNYVTGLVSQLRDISDRLSNQPGEYNIYFGGGSPNLLSVDQLDRILEAFLEYQEGSLKEVSMELHPEAAQEEGYLKELVELGVNRVSFGLQTVNSASLRRTVRHHTVGALDECLKEARKLGLATNVDVMYGGFLDETLESDKETFMHVFSRLQPTWVTGYQVCIQEGTPDFEKYQKESYRYPNTIAILSARALFHQIAESEGYYYLGGDYFSKDQGNPNYQEKKWGNRNAVISLGSGTYSYIIDRGKSQGNLWWSPFDTRKYLQLVRDGKAPVERSIEYTPEDIESWTIMSQLKKGRVIKNQISAGFRKKLIRLVDEGFLDSDSDGFSLSSQRTLVEDLVYASLIPRSTWESFREKRKRKDYSQEAKYDWFFEQKQF